MVRRNRNRNRNQRCHASGYAVALTALRNAAGNLLLQRAVHAIRAHQRSYDLIVRIGGDEFLCVMSDASIDDAHQRFNVIQAALAADPDGCEIKVGFAALVAEDSAVELIRRADADLPRAASVSAHARDVENASRIADIALASAGPSRLAAVREYHSNQHAQSDGSHSTALGSA